MTLEASIDTLATAINNLAKALTQTGNAAVPPKSNAPAPKEKEKAAPKEKEKDAPAPKTAYKDVQSAVMALMNGKGRQAVVDALAELDVTNARDLPEERWPEALKLLVARND